MRRLRIAWFSPLPDEKSSLTSAYTSALLLPEIASHAEIDLYTNSFKKNSQFPTYHYLKAFRNHRESPYDLLFYQLEDKEALNFVRFHLGLLPGIVWFHDALLSNAGPVPILNSPWSDIIKKYNNPSFPWPSRDKVHTFRGPLAYRELGYAAVPVFSSEVAHGEYRRNIVTSITADVREKSFFVPLPIPDRCFETPLATERSLETPLVCGIAGSPHVENRIDKVLQAIEESGAPVELLWLVPERHLKEAKQLCERFEQVPVELIPGESAYDWENLLSRIHVALHLSFTVFGHLEPLPGLSLALGKEVVVTDFGISDYLPHNLVWKVLPGESEIGEIAMLLRKLSVLPLAGNNENRKFAFERYHKSTVAQNLQLVFEHAATELLPGHSTRWQALLQEAKESLFQQSESLVEDDYFRNCLMPSFQELGWLPK